MEKNEKKFIEKLNDVIVDDVSKFSFNEMYNYIESINQLICEEKEKNENNPLYSSILNESYQRLINLNLNKDFVYNVLYNHNYILIDGPNNYIVGDSIQFDYIYDIISVFEHTLQTHVYLTFYHFDSDIRYIYMLYFENSDLRSNNLIFDSKYNIYYSKAAKYCINFPAVKYVDVTISFDDEDIWLNEK